MGARKRKSYIRLTLAERLSIEQELSRCKDTSCRSIARNLGRSVSSIFGEVKRYRVVTKGAHKFEAVEEVPEGACLRLVRWPYVCNGCRYRHYHCNKPFRAEYRARIADKLSENRRKDARSGVNKTQEEFEVVAAHVQDGIGRGLSPEQIVCAYSLTISAATIYRWIAKGYVGLTNLELRRKVKYKPRRKLKPTRFVRDPTRSYQAFLELPEEIRAASCEMDTVIGKTSDNTCLLTLYLRPCKFQLIVPLAHKTSEEVVDALDSLERLLGTSHFKTLFGIILTDNGSEFLDASALEASQACASTRRCSVYYCDPRQSQQKGSCEKNHVEIRKVLPKGTSFESLTRTQCALLMSHINSEPRPSLAGLSPVFMLKAAYKEQATHLLEGLGVEEIPIDELLLTPRLLEARQP